MSRQKELLRNTIIIGVGNICTSAISFILVPLYTLWLTPSEYGDYDLLYSYISLIIPFITLQLEKGVFRYTLESKERGFEYFRTCLMIVIINSFIFSFLCVGVLSFQYHIAFTFCAVSYSFEIYSTEFLRGLNKLKEYSTVNIICGVCIVIYSFLFVYVFSLGVNGLFTAYGLAYLSSDILIIFKEKLYRIFKFKKYDKKILKLLLIYSIPLLPNAVSWWVTNVSDRTLINIFLGSSYNGIYAVCCKIPSLVTLFYSMFNLAWQQSAILSASDDENEQKLFYNNIFLRLFMFLFSSAICIITITPFFYKLFIDERYYSGIPLVPILILSTTLLNISQYLGGILLGRKDTKTNGITIVIAAIANLAVDFALINRIGLYAAALSTFISYAVMFILRLYKLRELFDIRKVLSSSLIGVVIIAIISVIEISITNDAFHFIIFLLSLVLFVYCNKRTVLDLVYKVKGKKN